MPFPSSDATLQGCELLVVEAGRGHGRIALDSSGLRCHHPGLPLGLTQAEQALDPAYRPARPPPLRRLRRPRDASD
jgi:hypothetical protein